MYPPAFGQLFVLRSFGVTRTDGGQNLLCLFFQAKNLIKNLDPSAASAGRNRSGWSTLSPFSNTSLRSVRRRTGVREVEETDERCAATIDCRALILMHRHPPPTPTLPTPFTSSLSILLIWTPFLPHRPSSISPSLLCEKLHPVSFACTIRE